MITQPNKLKTDHNKRETQVKSEEKNNTVTANVAATNTRPIQSNNYFWCWCLKTQELFVPMDSDLGCEVICNVRTIKEYQLENCGIFEPPPFHLSRIVHDEWTAWQKLWRNLGATENQIYCLILHDVKARLHERAEEIEVWSRSYPRSLQTVWIGTKEQSVGQIRIHYSKPIAEISSTHRAPWTRARMWTIQGLEAFEMLKDMVDGTAHRYRKPGP